MINARLLDLVRVGTHYGFDHQEVKLIEELGELTTALSRHVLSPELREHRENLIEEMADVQVLMNQVLLMSGELKSFEEYYNTKLDRQLKRIKEGE